jgi:hypothetical protein
MRLRAALNAALLSALYSVASARADIATDLTACADERVKTAMLPIEEMVSAEASCTRVLEGRRASRTGKRLHSSADSCAFYR